MSSSTNGSKASSQTLPVLPVTAKPSFGSVLAAKFISIPARFGKLKLVSLLIGLLFALPLITLFFEAFSSQGDSFTHIRETVLNDYIVNTLLLMFGVGVLVIVIGVPLAWLIAVCEFKGRGFFKWALILPLAMPAYVVAYTYTDLLDYAGPIQIALRQWFDWQSPGDYWFFEIRSLSGAALMLALVLYPYVYLMVRASFMEQNATLTHAARSLGASPTSSFFRVSLPLARNAIMASCALVMMESMADFATVNYFAVSTLTTAVYDTWLGHYDLASAAKLSVIMVLGVFSLLYLERFQNGRRQTRSDAKVTQQPLRYRLNTGQTMLAWGLCGLILSLGFIIPSVILMDYAIRYFSESWSSGVWDYAVNSSSIALITAALALVFSVSLNYFNRTYPSAAQGLMLKAASTGYAIPGTVLAIGVLVPLTFLDTQINELAEAVSMTPPGLLLSGSAVAIVFAHLVRFIAIANKGILASYEKISPSLDMVAKTMGQGGFRLVKRVHLPLLRRSALVAALLVFVESMKELPAALLLRPFDFQTLPTYVYQFASDEQLEIAALGAILIVAVGLLPLWLLNRSIDAR